jgi:hypothetical protein
MLSLLAGLLLALAPSHTCTTLVVTKHHASYRHYTTIQAAVKAAQPCDWVLVAPGVYRESGVVRTPSVHMGGLNRNRVIVDGRHTIGNGIEVAKASNVWIENVTVRNFDHDRSGEDGNEIWWNGGDESGTIGAHGWWGNYLTTYDTGLTGGYGLFVSNSVGGGFDHVYASGFSDSGVYIGACPDCRAYVRHALVERNALGYSGTNAGGHLVVEDSTFRNNAIGVGPNSLPNDIPPPQLGTCDSAQNTSPTPTIASAQVARCTIFRRNHVVYNNNLTVPANELLGSLPWGVGIEMPGTYGDLIENNVVRGNKNFGILGFENPVPFPPTDATIYFQFSGNAIERNAVSGSGYADIAMAGGLFGQKSSVNNCIAGNKAAKTMPADLTPWSCSLQTTPNPDSATSGQLVGILLKLQEENQNHVRKPQPAPPAQPTMPRPCRGAPKNPLC